MTPKKSKKAEPSQSFLEKKEIIKRQTDAIKIKHKLKMEELAFTRETDRLYHEKNLERGRIKNAEFRKNLELKRRSYN